MTGAMRCLIVDDAPAVRLASASVLQLFWPDMDLEEASDAASALAAARRRPVDLVLLDMNLGAGPDGLAVLRELRSAAPGLRIVLITALPDDDPRVAAAEAIGIQGLLRKPVHAAQLRAVVEQAIAGGSARLTWKGSRSP